MKHGFVLLIVISLLGIMAVVGLAFIRLSHQHKNISHGYLLKTKSHLLIHSGYDYAIKKIVSAVTLDHANYEINVGDGTFIKDGDLFSVAIRNLEGCININDGIQTGHLEIEFDREDIGVNQFKDVYFNTYYANSLDPYTGGVHGVPETDNWTSAHEPVKVKVEYGGGGGDLIINEENIEIYEKARSALINLRLRRLLNAYGDVHRFIDQSYDGDPHNLPLEEYSLVHFKEGTLSLPEPVFSVSEHKGSDDMRRFSMSGKKNLETKDEWSQYNNGFGDRIIEARPDGGYKNLIEIKDIVNLWSLERGISLSESYLQGETFYDLITQDLTVVSFEDTEFFRLDDETRFGDFAQTDDLYAQALVGPHRANVVPQDLAASPPDFTDMWLPHSVPLINLNAASFFVAAAVFYAPTNVSYPTESATTFRAYPQQATYLAPLTGIESLLSSPSIGVGPPVFAENRGAVEHGVKKAGRRTHLMSMRDALALSYEFKNYYFQGKKQTVRTFDDFEEFLKRITPPFGTPYGELLSGDDDDDVGGDDAGNGDSLIPWFPGGGMGTDLGGQLFQVVPPGGDDGGGQVPPGGDGAGGDAGGSDGGDGDVDPLKTVNKIKFEKASDQKKHDIYIEGGEDFNALGRFHVANYDTAGAFSDEYIRRTLPHIFSCVRRIPGYLGAPVALQSPYIVVRPHYEDYVDEFNNPNGEQCLQAFRKVEDFVWRFIHPKVCFNPCGYYAIKSQAKIFNVDKELFSSQSVEATVKVFDTQYYRTQKSFDQITDVNLTDQDVKIGPEFKINQDVSQFLGFVGLKDFEGDLTWDDEVNRRDIFLTGNVGTDQGGYKPQIVMNFNPEENLEDPFKLYYGLINATQHQTLKPQATSLSDQGDPWIFTENNSLKFSFYEGANEKLYGNPKDNTMNQLNPFGGAQFSSINHGLFAHGVFTNSLYWRLDDWFEIGGSGISRPVGEDMSAGVMTFWFQVPSGYPYPTIQVNDPNVGQFDYVVNMAAFSHTLVSLNVWESYALESGQVITRPISLAVGLKKAFLRDEAKQFSPSTSLWHVFARYDAGGERYDTANPSIIYTHPADFDLIEAPYTSQSPEYNTLNLWAFHEGPFMYDESEVHAFSQKYFRHQTHRSVEVNVALKNAPENLPGSWHRASVFWNFRWIDDQNMMTTDRQLFIDLHDSGNRKSVNYQPDSAAYHRFRHSVVDGLGDGNSFAYPPVSDPVRESVIFGFMHPFDSTMVLALGESQGRLYEELSMENGGDELTIEFGHYYPLWRLNSSIDNLRIYLGPSDPGANLNRSIEPMYFQKETLESSFYSNVYSAMRYKILKNSDSFHGQYTDTDHEPQWVVDPLLPDNSKLLQIGSRVYYPPISNHPHVLFVASNVSDIDEPLEQDEMSLNEQVLTFKNGRKTTDGLKLFFKYKAYFTSLDGEIKPDDEETPLVYFAENEQEVGQHVLNIPWIKEVSIRHQSTDGVLLFDWRDIE